MVCAHFKPSQYKCLSIQTGGNRKSSSLWERGSKETWSCHSFVLFSSSTSPRQHPSRAADDKAKSWLEMIMVLPPGCIAFLSFHLRTHCFMGKRLWRRLLQQHRRRGRNKRRTHRLAKKKLQKESLPYFSKATLSSTGKRQERKAQAHSSAENHTINSSFLLYFGKHLYASVHTDSWAQERSFSSCWGFTVSAYILKYCKKNCLFIFI